MIAKRMHQRITGERRAFSTGCALLSAGIIVLASAPAAFADTDCADSGTFPLIPNCAESETFVVNNIEPPAPASPPHDVLKHRYLSIDPSTNAPRSVAIKVEVAEMRRCQNAPTRACLTDSDCDDVCDDSAGAPPHYTLLCPPNDCSLTDPASTCIASGPCVDLTPTFDPPLTWLVQEPVQQADGEWTAALSDTSYSDDWSAQTVLHIGACGIVPSVTYHVYACDPADLDTCSEPLEIATQRFPTGTPFKLYADVAGGTVLPGPEVLPPDGYVNVADLQVTLLTILNYGTVTKPQAHPTWADLHGLGTGIPPNYILNVADLQAVYVYSLTDSLPWVNSQGGLDPGDCPSGPRVGGYSNSGCLGSPRDGGFECDEDQVEFTPGPGLLHVLHRNALYNCCPDDIAVTLSVEGMLLRLTEEEVLTIPCPCVCCYDVEATIVNLDSGVYTVELCWYDYDTGAEECYAEDIEIP
ncbi:MAG: hypothetical protein ACYTFA_14695 [Planctomycetota bacterium]|jgi:hypothetical protein